MTERESKFMQAAIELSRHAVNSGQGGPFGCVIVKGNEIVGKGCNRVTADNDPTAHAEVVAIRDACRRLATWQLTDCEIFSSCEPCPMCMGAIYWARPLRVYFANTRSDAALAGFDDSLIYDELYLPLAQRKIAMIAMAKEDAWKVFEEWIGKENRLDY